MTKPEWAVNVSSRPPRVAKFLANGDKHNLAATAWITPDGAKIYKNNDTEIYR